MKSVKIHSQGKQPIGKHPHDLDVRFQRCTHVILLIPHNRAAIRLRFLNMG